MSDTNPKHTPTPWEAVKHPIRDVLTANAIGHWWEIRSAGANRQVARLAIGGPVTAANAAHIVQCVNEHASLRSRVAELEAAIRRHRHVRHNAVSDSYLRDCFPKDWALYALLSPRPESGSPTALCGRLQPSGVCDPDAPCPKHGCGPDDQCNCEPIFGPKSGSDGEVG